MQMSFLSSLKIADVQTENLRKDPVGIAIVAFVQKVDYQLGYANGDKTGIPYTPPRTRKEPAKRDPLDLRWYRKAGETYVTILKVGRLPFTRNDKPVVYEIGKTLDEVIAFFESLKKAATDRDPELVKEIMQAKAEQAKKQLEVRTAAPNEQLAEAAPTKLANSRKR